MSTLNNLLALSEVVDDLDEIRALFAQVNGRGIYVGHG